jgi:hypothetical protein
MADKKISKEEFEELTKLSEEWIIITRELQALAPKFSILQHGEKSHEICYDRERVAKTNYLLNRLHQDISRINVITKPGD